MTWTRERKEAMRQRYLGRKMSDEARRNMAEAHTGKRHSEETKAKIGAARREAYRLKALEQIRRMEQIADEPPGWRSREIRQQRS
jgi:hypothetical protein